MRTNLHRRAEGRWPRTIEWARFALAVLAAVPAAQGASNEGPPVPAAGRLRLALSAGALGEINPNDARASIIAWGRGVLESREAKVDVQPTIRASSEEMFRDLLRGQVDGMVALTDEYFRRPKGVDAEYVYLSLKQQKSTEQYVLLVRSDSGITERGGLRGKPLEMQKSALTSLAPYWLDVCLADHGLGLAPTVFRKIERPEKASRAVQRLFFRQADACIVTKEAYETMGELNPQLRRDLRVLATSPEVVPSVFFFRSDFRDRVRQEMETAILTLHETVAGRQALTVFQGDKLEKHPMSCLDSANDLLAAAARVRSAAQATAAGGTPLNATR